jgi:hypothetical protein
MFVPEPCTDFDKKESLGFSHWPAASTSEVIHEKAWRIMIYIRRAQGTEVRAGDDPLPFLAHNTKPAQI